VSRQCVFQDFDTLSSFVTVHNSFQTAYGCVKLIVPDITASDNVPQGLAEKCASIGHGRDLLDNVSD